MTHPEQPEHIDTSEEKLDHLLSLEPAYSKKMSAGAFVVSAAAHEYYGFIPQADVVEGAIPPPATINPRTPYIRTVLAAPQELSSTAATSSILAYNSQRNGICTVWVGHNQTPQEFDALNLKEALKRLGHDANETEVLAAIEPPIRQEMTVLGRKFYLIELLKTIEHAAITPVIQMREESYGNTAARKAVLAKEGMLFQRALADNDSMPAVETTRAVIEYGRSRVEKMTQAILNLYFEGDLAEHRTATFTFQ